MSIGLDELAIAPERVADLPEEDCRTLEFRLESVRSALRLRRELRPASGNGNGNGDAKGAPAALGDRIIDIKAAADAIGMSTTFLYRHPELPIFVKQGRRRMVSVASLEIYMKTLRAKGVKIGPR